MALSSRDASEQGFFVFRTLLFLRNTPHSTLLYENIGMMIPNKENAQTQWSIDQAHSEITLKVRHLMIANVRGSFKVFDASIYTTAKDFSTVDIDLWIDANSINTGDDKRDEHLKSADFLDVANHKQITFRGSSMREEDSSSHRELWGELTICGQSKNIKLDVDFGGIVKDPWGHEKAGFTVTGRIKRTDFGLIWNTAMEAGGILVSEDVDISCELELINQGTMMTDMVLDDALSTPVGL